MRKEMYTIKVEPSYKPSNQESFMDSDGGFWIFLNNGWMNYNENLDEDWFNSSLDWDEMHKIFGPIYRAQ